MCPVGKIKFLFDFLLLTLVTFSETSYVWKLGCMWVSASPQPQQYLLLSVLCTVAMLVDVK